jgi:hypothetical protein
MIKVNIDFKSKSPIQIVYGLSSENIDVLRAESENHDGYGWLPFLDVLSTQREEFMSGLEVNDLIILVQEPKLLDTNIRFVADYELDSDETNTQQDALLLGYSEDEIVDAGHELDLAQVDLIVSATIDLKYRKFIAELNLNERFDPAKFSVGLKDRDSLHEVGRVLYENVLTGYELSAHSFKYDDQVIELDNDYTAYGSDFVCLKRQESSWKRDDAWESFFNGY